MQQASTAATAVSVCGPDGGRHVDIGLQLEGGQGLARGMRHVRRALRGALAAPLAGELLLVHGSGLIPHLDVARGERLAAGKMSAWVLDTPLAEYSRSTEAFVARRVTRQIFATVVSGSRSPWAAAGLSIVERPTHSLSTSVSKLCFGIARAEDGKYDRTIMFLLLEPASIGRYNRALRMRSPLGLSRGPCVPTVRRRQAVLCRACGIQFVHLGT